MKTAKIQNFAGLRIQGSEASLDFHGKMTIEIDTCGKAGTTSRIEIFDNAIVIYKSSTKAIQVDLNLARD